MRTPITASPAATTATPWRIRLAAPAHRPSWELGPADAWARFRAAPALSPAGAGPTDVARGCAGTAGNGAAAATCPGAWGRRQPHPPGAPRRARSWAFSLASANRVASRCLLRTRSCSFSSLSSRTTSCGGRVPPAGGGSPARAAWWATERIELSTTHLVVGPHAPRAESCPLPPNGVLLVLSRGIPSGPRGRLNGSPRACERTRKI